MSSLFVSAAGAGMGETVARFALEAGAEVYATDLTKSVADGFNMSDDGN